MRGAASSPILRWPATNLWASARSRHPAVMAVSSSARHGCRKLAAPSLDTSIIAVQLASSYRAEGAQGKNEAHDAAGICEAASRPQMHFAPIKSMHDHQAQ